jgi:hypothetical protein
MNAITAFPAFALPATAAGTGHYVAPYLDVVVAVIDGRIQTTGFDAGQALSRATFP